MLDVAEWTRAVPGQFPLDLAFLSAVALAWGFMGGVIDIVLASIGGMVIGLFLGYWVLPSVVDAIRRDELAGRLRRVRRRGR